MNKSIILHLVLLFNLSILSSCIQQEKEQKLISGISGKWKSMQGRPSITILSTDSGYVAIVHHILANGKECAVAYPVRQTRYGNYIHAEGRIFISYRNKDKTLFLSPGGTYIRVH
ncbi:DUF3876 domain-containing protein [Parabacteroides bouchesdurhonensis]|uniref:DUF3876 domain-containing protein n=1 Tax=Parabacteroides bouchesdurhonensis TaxID=1936995 RepID=UPI000E474913|nr:DUF3876 domain-containing protein [Parabacteroides bouchesdurhonensis]RHJ91315.1 DUF3876 domain-containing protein [Bacteroides sp. AM07-16]